MQKSRDGSEGNLTRCESVRPLEARCDACGSRRAIRRQLGSDRSTSSSFCIRVGPDHAPGPHRLRRSRIGGARSRPPTATSARRSIRRTRPRSPARGGARSSTTRSRARSSRSRPSSPGTSSRSWASAYYFPNDPPDSLFFDRDDGIRLLVFLLVSLLITSLTSLRHRAQLALRHAYLELERRVEPRTQDLSAPRLRPRSPPDRGRPSHSSGVQNGHRDTFVHEIGSTPAAWSNDGVDSPGDERHPGPPGAGRSRCGEGRLVHAGSRIRAGARSSDRPVPTRPRPPRGRRMGRERHVDSARESDRMCRFGSGRRSPRCVTRINSFHEGKEGP